MTARPPGQVPLLGHDSAPPPPTSTMPEGQEPMVSITPLSEFVWNPPEFIRCRGRAGVNRVRYSFELRNPQQAVLCIDKPWGQYFPENRGRVMQVDTVEQFEGLTNILLSRPLMFIVATSCPARFDTLGPVNREFVVVVNTNHPSIRQQMKKILRQGLNDCRRRDRNFTVELDFNPAIEDGLRVLMDHAHDYCWQCWTDYRSEAGNIVITNYKSERKRTFMCRNKNDYFRALVCLPCCLFSCPCYRIKRCVECRDRRVAIKAKISYWLLTPASLPRANPIRHLRNTMTSITGRSGDVQIERACSVNRTIGGVVTRSSPSTQSVTVDLTPPPPDTDPPTIGTGHPLESAPPPPNYEEIIEQFEPLPLLTNYGMGVFEPTACVPLLGGRIDHV